MEIKLTVRAEIIVVLKLFAADKDTRYYLNGINLEVGATELRLVATNGHAIGCFRVKSEQPEVTTPLGNIIIPNDLLKHTKAKGTVEITIGPLETKNANGKEVPGSRVRSVTLTYSGVSVSGKTLDGNFPDFRRAIPSKVTGEPAQFNPLHIGALAKAYIALHGPTSSPCVRLGLNGKDGALIDLGDEDFVGVLMPLRPESYTTPVVPPTWLADSLCATGDLA